jgi:hypothetical protein
MIREYSSIPASWCGMEKWWAASDRFRRNIISGSEQETAAADGDTLSLQTVAAGQVFQEGITPRTNRGLLRTFSLNFEDQLRGKCGHRHLGSRSAVSSP